MTSHSGLRGVVYDVFIISGPTGVKGIQRLGSYFKHTSLKQASEVLKIIERCQSTLTIQIYTIQSQNLVEDLTPSMWQRPKRIKLLILSGRHRVLLHSRESEKLVLITKTDQNGHRQCCVM